MSRLPQAASGRYARSYPGASCVLLVLATACSPGPVPSLADPTLAITNVTVISVETGHRFPAQNVIMAGDRIQLVLGGAQVRLPGGVRPVDGTGKFLIPGFWDTHVHLSVSGPDVLPLFVAHGVTSVRDAGSRLQDVKAMRARISAREVIGPRIMTAGPILEGAAWVQAAHQLVPPGHPIWEVAPRVTVSAGNAQAVVDSLIREGVDYIMAGNVRGDDFLSLADATRRAGVPLASHNPLRVEMAAAAQAGLGSFEHAESVRGDVDTLIQPGSSLHDELELLVRDGGLSPLQALQSATRNPARFFGIEDELGTVSPGRAADLVQLDGNPLEDIRNTRRITGVVLGGKYLDRQALDSLAALRR